MTDIPRGSYYCFVLLVCVLSACVQDELGTDSKLQHLWTVSEGFSSAESVVYDAKREVLYVSSVNGYQKNGLGYLSRVSMDGHLLDQHWISGLNGPTGMAIWKDHLYVVDIDEVVVIDPESRQVLKSIASPNPSPGLNDIAVNADGRLFVSGSFSQTIYELVGDKLEPWLYSDQFRDANGLYADNDSVILAGYYLNRVSLTDKAITLLSNDNSLEDLESVESDGSGGYFITGIGIRPVMHLGSTLIVNAILRPDSFSTDMEYIRDKKWLLIPQGGDRLSAYRLEF